MGNEIRVGGTGPDRTRFAEHLRPPAPVVLEPPLGKFENGSAEDLTQVIIDRIYLLNERVGLGLPTLSTDGEYTIVLWEPNGYDFDPDSIRLFVRNSDAAVLDAGAGEDCWESTHDDPRVSGILAEFGRPKGEPVPEFYTNPELYV